MRETEPKPKTGCTGCFRWWLLIVVAPLVVLVGAGLAWNAVTDDPETISLTGEIVLRDAVSACGDTLEVQITAGEHDRTYLYFDPASPAPIRSCTLPLTAEVPVADIYTIAVHNRETATFLHDPAINSTTLRRTELDTRDANSDRILRVHLDW